MCLACSCLNRVGISVAMEPPRIRSVVLPKILAASWFTTIIIPCSLTTIAPPGAASSRFSKASPITAASRDKASSVAYTSDTVKAPATLRGVVAWQRNHLAEPSGWRHTSSRPVSQAEARSSMLSSSLLLRPSSLRIGPKGFLAKSTVRTPSRASAWGLKLKSAPASSICTDDTEFRARNAPATPSVSESGIRLSLFGILHGSVRGYPDLAVFARNEIRHYRSQPISLEGIYEH